MCPNILQLQLGSNINLVIFSIDGHLRRIDVPIHPLDLQVNTLTMNIHCLYQKLQLALSFQYDFNWYLYEDVFCLPEASIYLHLLAS